MKNAINVDFYLERKEHGYNTIINKITFYLKELIKIIKTITIIDNGDGTQYVQICNVDNNGTQLEIERGKIDFDFIHEQKKSYFDCPSSKVELIIKIQCMPDKEGTFYKYLKPFSLNNLTNDELIKELKNRKILSEEIVYKINS